jgi:TonB family protein
MNAAVAQERWQGQIIDGKFALLEWLGGSANTAVFRTELSGSTAQAAAIKLIRADSTNAMQQLARWKESAALSHSNLLRIFDSGLCHITGAHWLYAVTELAEENLYQVLPVRSLSSAEVAELLPPVLDALRFLHAKGLVHVRLKPSNIFAVNNQLKLSIDSVQSPTDKGSTRALSAYDAPEAESGVLSDASDIWSLGMTLVTAFNQRPLTWSRSSSQDLAVPKSVAAPFAQIAAECLRINAEERCSLDRINQILRQEPSSSRPVVVPKLAAPSRPAVSQKPASQVSSGKKFIIPLLIAVAVVAMIVGLISKRSTQQNTSPAAPATEQQANTPPQTLTPASPDASRSLKTVPAGSIIERVVPQVPRSARETITGKVRVKVQVWVGADGKVTSTKFVSSGPSKYFARLAYEASQKWRFTPTESVQSANRQWLLEYKFGRSGTEVSPLQLR